MALNFATGNGGTVTFSGFTGSYVSVGSVEQEVEEIEVSHLGTTGFKEYKPSDLKEGGDLECEFLFTGTIPTLADVQTLTVTYPAIGGGSTTTLSGTAFVKSVGYPELVNGDVMRGSVVFKFDGDTDPAFS